jgi:protein-tyrosine-phosphatase
MRRENLERNILFLCEDNACFSQMAEAAAKHLAPPKTKIFSAGVKPSVIPPHVVEAMKELGISMTGQKSKGLSDVPMQEIDLVVSFGGRFRALVKRRAPMPQGCRPCATKGTRSIKGYLPYF